MMIRSFIYFFALFVSLPSFASQPRESRDGRTCEEILSDINHSEGRPAIANNTFVPLSVLLSSTKCKMVAKNWREGPYHSKTLPTPGLLEMFRTADESAADVVTKLNLKGIESPIYDKRSPIEGAAKTLEMMESKNPPKYIRSGVLFREGVFTVVPILMLLKNSEKGGKPIYVPLVAKGHQDLDQHDILTAAFTSWALEPWQGVVPHEAYVHLVPMAKKRGKGVRAESESTFVIDPQQYNPIIKEVYEDFVATVSSKERLEEIEPRRCTECNRCPWANYCRGLLKEKNDLSMMPLPPSELQVSYLAELGLGDMQQLSKLDINSNRFFEAVMHSGINSRRLRYMVAHAKSTISGRPLRMDQYVDPFANKDVALHVDFEDIMHRDIKSGVYLFGVETQPLKHEAAPPKKKEFFFAKELSQKGVDDAWATFIRFIKDQKSLDADDWVLTMYSKHEVVKFEQQFDVTKGRAKSFSKKEKESGFYFEHGEEDNLQGWLIRRTEFFEDYPDIKPEDIFKILNHTVDLLDYTRKMLAFPTHSNGLKYVIKYVQNGREKIEYPPGSNGLESMAWAREAYAREEQAYFDQAKDYNEIDIDANRLIADFIRQHADLPMARQLKWTAKTEEFIKILDLQLSKRAKVSRLLDKANYLEKATKKSLNRWSEAELSELSEILDRSAYLALRTEIQNIKSIDAREKASKLQKKRFEYLADRQRKLHDLLIKINPELEAASANSPMHQSFVYLLEYPAHLLTPKHLDLMVAIRRMERSMSGHKFLKKRKALDIEEKISLPDEGWELFDRSRLIKDLTDEEVLALSELKILWEGLYLNQVF